MLTSVNPNTVIKALTWLLDNEILSTQRGVGTSSTEGAAAKTLALKRREFIEEDLAGGVRQHAIARRGRWMSSDVLFIRTTESRP